MVEKNKELCYNKIVVGFIMMEKKYNKCFRIFFIILLISLTITLSGCKKKVESYSDIERITHKEILNQKGNKDKTYFVVIYSNTCTFCEDLEPTIIEYCAFIKKNNGCASKNYPPMYALNINATKDNPNIKANSDNDYTNFTGTTDYNDIKFSAAPALVVVTNKTVEKFISSKVTNTPVSDVKILLNKIMK